VISSGLHAPGQAGLKVSPPVLGTMNFGELPASSDCYVRDVTLQQLLTAYNNAQSRSAGGAN
jgi:hypothetical protein